MDNKKLIVLAAIAVVPCALYAPKTERGKDAVPSHSQEIAGENKAKEILESFDQLMIQAQQNSSDSEALELRAAVIENRTILPQNNALAARWLLSEVAHQNRPQEIREVLEGYDLAVIAFRCLESLKYRGDDMQDLRTKIMLLDGLDSTFVNALLQEERTARLKTKVAGNGDRWQWLFHELGHQNRPQEIREVLGSDLNAAALGVSCSIGSNPALTNIRTRMLKLENINRSIVETVKEQESQAAVRELLRGKTPCDDDYKQAGMWLAYELEFRLHLQQKEPSLMRLVQPIDAVIAEVLVRYDLSAVAAQCLLFNDLLSKVLPDNQSLVASVEKLEGINMERVRAVFNHESQKDQ